MTHSNVDIWQKFGYGLRVKRKGKYLHNRKSINIAIILRNEITGNNKLQTPKTKYG